MKIKKPTMSGIKNTEYLGRFKKDKFIQQGHNGTLLNPNQLFGAITGMQKQAAPVAAPGENLSQPMQFGSRVLGPMSLPAPEPAAAPASGGMLGAIRGAVARRRGLGRGGRV